MINANNNTNLRVSGMNLPINAHRLLWQNSKSDLDAGFTLIELLVSVVVLAILATMALPSFQNLLMNYKVAGLGQSLFNSLNYARITALNQNVGVKLCPFSAAGSNSCGSNWGLGWIVITQPTSGSALLLQANQLNSAGPVLSASGVTDVTFNTRGLASNQSNFKICDSRGANYASSLMVLATGYTQMGSTLGKGVWNGGALSCP